MRRNAALGRIEHVELVIPAENLVVDAIFQAHPGSGSRLPVQQDEFGKRRSGYTNTPGASE
jgi:hypothetical protein